MNAAWWLIVIWMTVVGLACLGLLIEWIETRRAHHAADKAARDAEDASYRRALDTASQVGGATWPPARRR